MTSLDLYQIPASLSNQALEVMIDTQISTTQEALRSYGSGQITGPDFPGAQALNAYLVELSQAKERLAQGARHGLIIRLSSGEGLPVWLWAQTWKVGAVTHEIGWPEILALDAAAFTPEQIARLQRGEAVTLEVTSYGTLAVYTAAHMPAKAAQAAMKAAIEGATPWRS